MTTSYPHHTPWHTGKRYILLMLCLILTYVYGAPAYGQSSSLGNQTAPILSPVIWYQGHFTQGGFAIGKTYPFSVITHDGYTTRTDASGYFVIGFAIDSGMTTTITVIPPQDPPFSTVAFIRKRTFRQQNITGVNQKYIAPPESIQARIKKEGALVSQIRRDIMKRADLPLTASAATTIGNTPYLSSARQWPLKKHRRITGVYGSARLFNNQLKSRHYGIDIAAPRNTDIYPIMPGIVMMAQYLYLSGGTVIIDHGGGISSTYLHLDSMSIKANTPITTTVPLGKVGSTGRSTGPHLDLRVNWGNVRLDPALWLDESVGVQ